MIKICHLTSVHPRFDTRIFQRMCKNLPKEHFETYLVVADQNDAHIKDNVIIHSIGKSKNRFLRILIAPYKILITAVKLNADIYHLHDPELLVIVPFLKLFRKKVIFDFHEDFSEQVLSKEYLNRYIAFVIKYLYEIIEKAIVPMLDGVVSATPFINKKYKKLNRNAININNYPELNLIKENEVINGSKKNVCYVGAITKERGIIEILDAIVNTGENCKLELAGIFADEKIKKDAMSHPAWKKVIFHGRVSYDEVPSILNRCIAGMVIFHPIANHINSQPNKLFEYMAAGLPIIASNFPLWEEIIKNNNIGYHVNPLNPSEIENAIRQASINNKFNNDICNNAKQLIRSKYNWEVEFKKLINMYDLVQG